MSEHLKQTIVGKRLDASRIVTKLIPIEDIEDHDENYNFHPEFQIVSLSKSHDEFGQYRSICVWERPNGKYIRVIGHGYSAGAKKSGETLLRCEVLPQDTDPMTIKAIMAADNLHAQNSDPDETALCQLLQEQRNAGFDLASLGTDEESLHQMLESLGDEYLDEDGKGRTTELNAPEGGDVESAHNVLVECEDEAEQQRAYEMLTEEGFKCKVLTL